MFVRICIIMFLVFQLYSSKKSPCSKQLISASTFTCMQRSDFMLICMCVTLCLFEDRDPIYHGHLLHLPAEICSESFQIQPQFDSNHII